MSGSALAIGAVAAKWVFRYLMPEVPVEEMGGDLLSVVRKHVDGREGRRASRSFEEIAEEIADRLEPFVETEFRMTSPNDRAAAALATARTLEVGVLDSEIDVVRLNLDAAVLEETLRALDPGRAGADRLGEAGGALYDLLLSECCSYIVAMVAAMPTFTGAALKEVLGRTDQVLVLTKQVLDRIPATMPDVWGAGSEDQVFASRYLKAVVQLHDRLQIFGVRNAAYRSTYSLSVAYISLSATTPSCLVSAPPDESGRDQQIDDIFEDKDSLMDKSDPDAAALRVESALSGHPRIILSGGAGSGKTTLLQWLAVTASRAGFTDQLEEWNGSIPFVIPLRRFVGEELPSPENFVGVNHRSLAGVMPSGWAHRTLGNGNALVLVDGLDELPEAQRGAAREWLEDLVNTFPNARYVVTSRPLAVSRDWHEISEFRSAELLPMQRSDIREFIGHWHEAAKKAADSQEERDTLAATERHLLSAVHEIPHIRALCTSPLLCALICALHRHNVNRLPQNRLELYETALEMLVSSRDEERTISPADLPSLTYAEKRAILADFAAWLHENGESDATSEVFISRVSRTEKSLARSGSIDGEKLAAYLLQRSGVLRQPVEGRVDFVHRTFLEYLAAVQFVEDDAVGKIVDHAHLDQWREVTILAAGVFSAHRRERLLTELVQRGRDEPAFRHRLFLLAVASQETATTLSTELQEVISGCLDEVVPPENMTDAAAVASAGNLAVPRLGSTKRMLATTAAACVRALALIGTDEALAQLRSYSGDRRLTVHKQLIRAWGQFDPREYAEEVLGKSPLGHGSIVITDPEQQQYLGYLEKVRSVSLDFGGKIDSLASLVASDVVTALNACRAKRLLDLNDLVKFPNLGFLYIERSPSLRSLEGLESCPKLVTLYLDSNPSLEDFGALNKLGPLAQLHIGFTKLDSIDRISSSRARELRVGGVHFRHLGIDRPFEALYLYDSPGLEDLESLRTWEGLRDLHFSVSTERHESLVVPSGVTRMSVSINSASTLEMSGGESIDALQTYGGGRFAFASPLPSLSFLMAPASTLRRMVDDDRSLGWAPRLSSIHVFGRGAAEIDVRGFERVGVSGRPVHSARYKRT